jgi:hypothetical protein
LSPFDTTHFLTPSPHQNRPRRARVEKVGLAEPNLKARFIELGSNPIGGSSADYRALLSEESERWAKVVSFAAIKPD